MNGSRKRFVAFFIFLVVTVQVAFLCCNPVARATERPSLNAVSYVYLGSERTRLHDSRPAALMAPTMEIKKLFESNDTVVEDNVVGQYSVWLCDELSSRVYTRADWLAQLMDVMGYATDSAGSYAFSDQYLYPCSSLFVSAYEHGLVDSQMYMEPFAPLTRRYMARTVTAALGYADHAVECADLYNSDTALMTMVYFGYFVPDDENRVYPDAVVTADEAEAALDEVRLNRTLKGQHLLAFGDSIMYGMGTDGVGIADMIGEKYGMKVADYSENGAAFESIADRALISDQVKAADKANEPADLILLNGGTNDISTRKLGEIADGFDYKSADKKTFSGSLEYTLGLIEHDFGDVPMVYIRAHNMNAIKDALERQFGERAVAIAEKWGCAAADIYADTALNTEDDTMCALYTLYREEKGKNDSIHPNTLCYSKFYVPLLSERIAQEFME